MEQVLHTQLANYARRFAKVARVRPSVALVAGALRITHQYHLAAVEVTRTKGQVMEIVRPRPVKGAKMETGRPRPYLAPPDTLSLGTQPAVMSAAFTNRFYMRERKEAGKLKGYLTALLVRERAGRCALLRVEDAARADNPFFYFFRRESGNHPLIRSGRCTDPHP